MKNLVHKNGEQISLPVPAGSVSGNPVVAGQIPGVCMTDRQADGEATVKTNGVAEFDVKGVDQIGNSAVAVGDILFHVEGDTPKLSKKNTGVRFGYAMGTVASGATTKIPVKIGF